MIRALSNSDLNTVLQLWLDVNILAHDFIDSSFWQKNAAAVKDMLPQAQVYVYEQEGQILGFIGLENDYIAGIFVHKKAQSKGIGKRLLDYAKGEKPCLILRVYEQNTRAVRFYKREQFKIQTQEVDKNTGKVEFVMKWCRTGDENN